MSAPSALDTLLILEKDARDFGFRWPDVQSILDQLSSECQEVQESLNAQESRERTLEEVGDVLHAALSLLCFLEANPHHVLQKTAFKFQKRMNVLKQVAAEHGYTSLQGVPFNEMQCLWDEAKTRLS